MTKEKMAEITKILFDNYHLPSKEAKEGKLRTIYKFFQTTDPILLEEAYWHIVGQNEARFPTIPQIGEALRIVKSRIPIARQDNKAKCVHCRGDGRVTAIDSQQRHFAYRCCCANGVKYPNYSAWFGIPHEGKTLLNQTEDDVKCNPAIYKKGLKYLDSISVRMPQAGREKIEKLIELGEEREV